MRVRVAMLCVLAGCAVEVGPGPSGPGTDGTGGTGDLGPGGGGRQIPTNGLHIDPLQLAQLQTAPLSGDWVDGVDGDLLAYVAVCALAEDQELAGTRGYYGLATAWADAPCDGACQRWVSACLLAHANAFSEPVQISPRGAHPGLAAPDPAFDFQEAAFYGNVFTGDAAALEMFGCAGRGLFDASQAIDGGDYYLRGRICGVSPACGMINTGLCNVIPDPTIIEVPGIGACEIDGGLAGAYGDCHVGDRLEGEPRESPVVAEVITVYLGP